jgi:uroporphyrinogen-III synthase
MADLGGRRIVILEARLGPELASLVRRHGGIPILAPALREVPESPEAVRPAVEALLRGAVFAVFFLTGVGARTFLEMVAAALRRTLVFCRGPKPVAVLRARGIPVAGVAPEPHTVAALLRVLEGSPWDFRDRVVLVQHYGERKEELAAWLNARGARLLEISPYRWALPEDRGPLRRAVRMLVSGEADAILFSSRPQVAHLFQTAAELGLLEALKEALQSRVVVGALGPVCAGALAEHGIKPQVVPDHGKLGHLVVALARFFEERGGDGLLSAGA